MASPDERSAPVVRFATPNEIPAVRRFLAENFAPDAHQNRPGWLEWQLASPLGTRVAVSVVEEEIAGLSIFLRACFRVENVGETDGAFATSTMVSRKFRRRGIGSALHRFRAEQYGYALSTGQSDANAKVYGHLGFAEMAAYREFLLCCRFPPFFAKKRWLRHVHSWLQWRLSGRLLRSARIESVGWSSLAVPDTWLAERGSGDRLPQVSNEYVKWRYGEHPYLQYEASRVFDGERPVGLVIHRLLAGGVWRIVDVYCGAGELAAVLNGFCRAVSARRLEGLVAGRGLAEAFALAGFSVFPHGSRIVGGSERVELAPALTDGHWGFFAGDSDKDR